MRPLLEEKEFTQNERMRFAEKFLPIFSGEEEQLKDPVKTSRFQETDPMEEFHIQLSDGDTLGFIKSKTQLDFDSNFRSQERLTSMFRQMALDPVVDQGLTQICDEAMSFNHSPDSEPMKLMVNKEKLARAGLYSEQLETKIYECYEEVLGMLDFREKGWEYFHQWFVDGKIFFELVFDQGEKSIQEVNLLSPYNIMKVKARGKYYYLYDGSKEKEVLRRNMLEDDAYLDDLKIPIVNYQAEQARMNQGEKIKLIPEKYVIAIESGIRPFGYPLSPLYYVRKNLNQLQLLQDAVVVYRISRAPERRVIYVDVGSLRQSEVKQAMNEVAKEFKQKLVFDQRTGNILDHRHVFATTEDFFIPRYGNGQTTQIDTLKGGEQLGKIQDMEYFLEQTYRAMKIPLSRFGLGETSVVNIGNDSAVQRDEITFSRYIKRLRHQFIKLIWGLLQRQLLCKNVISLPSEFRTVKLCLHLFFEGENYYADLQRMDQQQKKFTLYQQVEPLIDSGRISEFQAYRDILGMSHEDVQIMYSEKSQAVAMKLEWLNANLEMLREIAKIEGDLAMLQNPELQVKTEMLKQKAEFRLHGREVQR
jgi:hypothetical protein